MMLNRNLLESQAKLKEEQQGCVTSSGIGSIFNLGWGCRKRYWYEKREIEPDFPQGSNPNIQRGNLMEPVTRLLLEIESGRMTRDADFVRSRFWPLNGSHPDAYVYPTADKPSWGILEIKNVSYRMLRKYKSEGLPYEYILQIQHAMMCAELVWGTFAIHCLDPWQLHYFDIDLDSELVDKIINAVDLFWKQVTEGPAPDSLDPTDKRCHSCAWRRTCQGEALLGVIPEEDREGEVDDSLEPLVREYEYRKELADEALSLLAETQDQIREKLGKRPLVLAGGIPIRHSIFPVTRWDTKALNALWDSNEEFRQQMEKYRKTSSQKRLSIGIKYKPNNGENNNGK